MLSHPENESVGKKAFSLIELIAVLAIITILAAIAVPRYADAIQRHRADAAARRIIADLELARAKAGESSRSKTVVFNVAAGKLTILGVSDLVNPSLDYTTDLAGGHYRTMFLAVSFNGATQVTFDGFGMPDNGGVICIITGTIRKIIMVDKDTGGAKCL